MSTEILDNVIDKFGEEGRRFLAGRTQALSDEEMAGVSGGVGNAGEGTAGTAGSLWNGTAASGSARTAIRGLRSMTRRPSLFTSMWKNSAEKTTSPAMAASRCGGSWS